MIRALENRRVFATGLPSVILPHCALCRNRKKNPDQRTIYRSSVQYVFKGQVQYSEKQVFFSLLILQDLHVLPSLPLFAQISLYQDKRSVN